MQSFSERHGYVKVRSVVQVEEMDIPLRTALWNATFLVYVEPVRTSYGQSFEHFQFIWSGLMGGELDRFPTFFSQSLKDWILTEPWNRVYDLLEYLNSYEDQSELYNAVLEQHLAGYRFLNGRIVPISDSHELTEIESAVTLGSGPVKHHLQQAIQLLSDRDTPDYPNSIKESISALEAFLMPITGKNTLGQALTELKAKRVAAGRFEHKALLGAWSQLYGWSSDENGIRHGGETVPHEAITQSLARYILITCAAFINLMTAEQAAVTP
ncbi:AbiJ-NTD4 domain-containing protein [Nocardia sp. NPDC003726]